MMDKKLPPSKKDLALPIGVDNFSNLVRRELDFVDKTLLIRDLLKDRGTEVTVITRPRRFGKTLNLSMLHYFFSEKVNGQPTHDLFKNLNIAQHPECMQHQGRYPVIFITFKGIIHANYADAYNKLSDAIRKVYSAHAVLQESPKLRDDEKEIIQSILKGQATLSIIERSLQMLTDFLERHYGEKPWVLIDEYDTPIQAAYLNGYYKEMSGLMRGLLGEVLKGNDSLHRSVVTGILRVAKESLFSGVNNLNVFSILRNQYSEYFGFTEPEVNELLKKAHLEDKFEEIRDWYNGYHFGGNTIYNPWSIINCIQQHGDIRTYWLNTSGNELVQDLILKSTFSFKEGFEKLLAGQPLKMIFDEYMVFEDFQTNESAVWNLLLMSGYLKLTDTKMTDQGLLGLIDIPNREIRNLYRKMIEGWFAPGSSVEWYNKFLGNLLSGNIKNFEQDLKILMEQTSSVHDIAQNPESFYHGFFLGLTASLYQNENYELYSNRESGYGRYDYMVFSKDLDKPTLLFEFKKIEMPKDPDTLEEKLENSAKEALNQIKTLKYWTEVQQRGRKNIILVGLSFCGKKFNLQHILNPSF